MKIEPEAVRLDGSDIPKVDYPFSLFCCFNDAVLSVVLLPSVLFQSLMTNWTTAVQIQAGVLSVSLLYRFITSQEPNQPYSGYMAPVSFLW